MTMTRLRPLILSCLGGIALASPALADVPRIVTDTPVAGALVQQVLGDLGQPEILLDTGGDPHNYQLRPSQARSLQSADLLIWIGPELSPWLARTAGAMTDGSAIALLATPQTELRDFGSAAPETDDHDHGDHDHEAHDHDAHDHADDHEAEDHAGHDHAGIDPHAWLDPENGKRWLTAIADLLAERDPQNAASYRANADQGIARIAELDASLGALLAPLRDRQIAVFHDAYGYFTAHYGLKPAIAVSLGDASQLSAARLKEVQSAIARENVACAFPEANHDPKLLHVALEGTGTRLGAALDPEGVTLERNAGLYPAILENLGRSIAGCLSEN